MAFEIPVFTFSLEAAADLSAKQYTYVKLDTNGRAAAVTAATDIPVGILQNKPAALGREAVIVGLGISKVVANGAITAADQVGTSADGQCDGKTAGTDTTEYAVGQALTAATAATEILSVTVNTMNPHRAA
jgi:hypothetical protein